MCIQSGKYTWFLVKKKQTKKLKRISKNCKPQGFFEACNTYIVVRKRAEHAEFAVHALGRNEVLEHVRHFL